MNVPNKVLIYAQRDADNARMTYFTQWRKERRYIGETQAREMLARGEAMVHRMKQRAKPQRGVQHEWHVMEWRIAQFVRDNPNALPDLKGLQDIDWTATEKPHVRKKRAGGLLLPQRYKSEKLAIEAAEELQSVSPFEGAMCWLPVRCIGNKEDTKPFSPEKAMLREYHWRLRRTFK